MLLDGRLRTLKPGTSVAAAAAAAEAAPDRVGSAGEGAGGSERGGEGVGSASGGWAAFQAGMGGEAGVSWEMGASFLWRGSSTHRPRVTV